MPHDCHVRLAGRRYKIRYGRAGKDRRAYCDHPATPRPEIVVSPAVKGDPRELMHALLHEALHALFWPLSEEWTEGASLDIAELLLSQGFTLIPKG